MKQVPNSTFDTLLRDLPAVLKVCRPDAADLKAANAKRRVQVALRKLNRIDSKAK